MNVDSVIIDLEELQEALVDFMFKKGWAQVTHVTVERLGSPLLEIPLTPGATCKGRSFVQSSTKVN